MDVWKKISGIITMELTSAEPELTLSTISSLGIDLFQLQKLGDLTWSFQVLRKDCKAVQDLCAKQGGSWKITCQMGLYYVLSTLFRRRSLIAGTFLLLFLTLFLPTRILFVQVEGNQLVPSSKILAAAEDAGICFGSSRREIRSEKVKNRLLASIPQLQWAGINTAGCVATISVREQALPQERETKGEVTSIIAAQDGYILSATATEGNLLVQPGQTVKAGQVLISGYTDCGLCIQATQSSGEIYAQTNRTVSSVTPSLWTFRQDVEGSSKKVSLLWRKKRINLWKGSGNVRPVCGRMYEEYYVTLPGGFSLPFGLCIETVIDYDTAPGEMESEHAEYALSSFTREYLRNIMVAGQILEGNEACTQENGIYRLTGSYICSEMIGREQLEQIGDHNGKIG